MAHDDLSLKPLASSNGLQSELRGLDLEGLIGRL